jgi:hypothetical protein
MSQSSVEDRLESVFIDIQNQATLTLFDKTKPLGLFFRVDRHGEWLRCEVCTENNTMSYGHFTIGARLIDGKLLLKSRIVSNNISADEFDEVEQHIRAMTVLLEVCRMIDKTYCQPWNTNA